ncbi:MAG: histidine kinase [Bacteroidota bacterium]|nr:histidine kinase [Flavisolibacter sp.]MDQ3845372.1 histidine kinase [Bacteroidota bacterium]MBD0287151.1 histidine kinase [Flavisolibacter sp.]MBD0351666.1 histidine kinase [Flavisolibacter sp.]MBD0366203.1 histidine kinase [Flavisolibacter sp.]
MAASFLSIFRFRWSFFSGWLLWALLHALIIHSFIYTWKTALIDSLISNGLLFLAGLLLVNTLRYYIPQSNRYFTLLAWILVLTIIWLFISRFVLLLVVQQENYHHFLQQSLLIRFSISFLIIASIVLMSVAWYNWQEQQELQARKNETDKIAKDAELYKLRQQLQPHFLFNSLNSINALIGMQPAEARRMVLQLSEFLRGTLKKEEHQWVSLQEEMEYLRLYLDIEKVRFGHRLTTQFYIEKETGNLHLPSLILQPVVENAIKFGLYDTTEEIVISISAKREENMLILQVQNPFDPETTLPGGTGFGLSSIQRRLFLLFGRNDLLTTIANENRFTTELRIPQSIAP